MATPLVWLNTDNLNQSIYEINQKLDLQHQNIEGLWDAVKDQKDITRVHESKINQLELHVVNLQALIDSVKRLEDKVDAWSERVRELDERNLQIVREMNDGMLKIQQQINKLEDEQKKHTEQVVERLEKEILMKYGENELNAVQRHEKFYSEYSDFRLKQLKDTERLNAGLNERIDELAKILKFDGSESDDSPFNQLFTRIHKIEDKIKIIAGKDEFIQSIERMALKDEDLTNPNIRKRVIRQLVHNLIAIAQDFHAAKVVIENIFNVQNQLPITEFPDVPGQISIEQRISRMEGLTKGLSEMSFLNNKIAQLEVQMAQFLDEEDDFKVGTTPTGFQVAPPQQLQRRQTSIKNLDDKYEKLENKLNKMQTLSQKFTKQEDITEALNTIQNKIREPLIRQMGNKNEEITQKLKEIEDRFNAMWRESKTIQQNLDEFKQDQQNQSNKQLQVVETVSNHLEKIEDSLSKQLEEKVQDLGKQIKKIQQDQQDPIVLYNEFRLVHQSFKSQLEEIREQLEYQQLNNENPEIMEQLDDEPDIDQGSLALINRKIRQLEIIVKQLANRSNIGGSSLPIISSNQDISISQLEDLRQEIKNIMQKQNNAQISTQRERELINQIHNALDSKINRDELQGKVEKPELQRAYRMLKKRIDEMQYQLKQKEKEIQKQQEEAFFAKRKIDTECASCGQQLLEVPQQSPQHTNWGRFPSRNSGFGPGFSRILMSLVQTQEGSFALPLTQRELPRTHSFSSKSQLKVHKPPKSAQAGSRKNLLKAQLPNVKN